MYRISGEYVKKTAGAPAPRAPLFPRPVQLMFTNTLAYEHSRMHSGVSYNNLDEVGVTYNIPLFYYDNLYY